MNWDKLAKADFGGMYLIRISRDREINCSKNGERKQRALKNTRVCVKWQRQILVISDFIFTIQWPERTRIQINFHQIFVLDLVETFGDAG